MRYTRKRFTPSDIRSGADLKRSVLTRNGVSRFSQSATGIRVRRERVMTQLQWQGFKCQKCQDHLALEDAVFRDKEFQAGTLPPLVHKKCKRLFEKEKARHAHQEN